MEYIALDCHKQYTYAVVENERGRIKREGKIPHEQGAIRAFLAGFQPGSPVAVETVGNWYWIVDEIEQAGGLPRLVHAAKAKLMLGMVNKTDKLDARGLNKLQRTGTLPTVWIPPGELRDKRELPRTRMVLVRQRTQLKPRLQATFAKYGLSLDEVSDPFGARGRRLLQKKVEQLLPETKRMALLMLDQIASLEEKISVVEERMREVLSNARGGAFADSPWGRIYPGYGNRIRGWGCAAVPEPRASGLLCGGGAPCARQWRQSSPWEDQGGREPLPQVGLCRSREQYRAACGKEFLSSCEPPLFADPEEERAPKGCRCGGPALGRGHVVGADDQGALPGAAVPKPRGSDGGVNAADTWSEVRLVNAGRPRKTLCPKRGEEMYPCGLAQGKERIKGGGTRG